MTEDNVAEFEDKVRVAIKQCIISWTLCRRTLERLITFMDEAETDQSEDVMACMRQCLRSLCLPTAWPFLLHHRPKESGPLALAQIEQEFERADIVPPDHQAIHRPCTKERIFLHVFSGRRREGDLQFFMEKLYDQTCMDGTTLCVVSLDLIIDRDWGNVRRPATQAFWLHGVKSGWVCGALCGPPCETWSQARYANHPEDQGQECRQGPRPLRDIAELWGFSSLSIREALQVATGNELLLFSLELLFSLACVEGFGVLEHPQEPEDETRPSIWRLALTRLLMRFPGTEIIDLAQGLLGAWSPKPTRFLALNLPYPIDEIPLFSNYSPCFHKIGYIQKIVYKKKLFS